MSIPAERLYKRKPVNRVAWRVTRPAHVDDLPPADKTYRLDARNGINFREGFEAATKGFEASSCPYSIFDDRRGDWFEGFDEACLQRCIAEDVLP